jgi:hypothetical protein
MIITIFRIAGTTHVDFTTDFSWWYYMKPVMDEMWHVETLGM